VRFAPDAAELSGDLSAFGAAAIAIDKSVSVNEGFVEMRAPIAQEQPLARDLTIGAGYRYSLYSTAGATNTYKFDLQYAPIADMRLRATYDRVVRAPNLIELYTPLSYTYSTTVSSDPCAPTIGGATHAPASLAQCMHTGLTAAEYGNGFGPAIGGTSTLLQCVGSICGEVIGGNPQLAPETAHTWSLGLTFTPTAIPRLAASLDYFHILLKGEIATVPAAITLQQCLATGEPTWCSQIVRTSTGELFGSTVAGGGYILQRDVNTSAALVSGMDIQANYLQPLPGRWGALRASLNGSWLQHNYSTPYQSAPSYDCAGLFGSTCLGGSANPKWRHNLRLTWETPWNVQFSAQWRYIGRTDFDNNSSQTLLQNQEEGFFDPLLTHIPSYSYLDMSAIWTLPRHVQLRAGVNNVFDKDPPFIPAEVSGGASTTTNTLPPTTFWVGTSSWGLARRFKKTRLHVDFEAGSGMRDSSAGHTATAALRSTVCAAMPRWRKLVQPARARKRPCGRLSPMARLNGHCRFRLGRPRWETRQLTFTTDRGGERETMNPARLANACRAYALGSWFPYGFRTARFP